MANYKFNFKDADCQYVEKYYAGKYNTPITIYKTEGDEITPKGYFATVGTVEVKGATIDEVKKNINAEANKRDKKLENAVVMDKKCKDTDYVKTPRGEFKVVEKTENIEDGENCINCKDSKKKVKDANADEIIDLFHEAYNKHRTWDWLKHKLPERFFTLYHKGTNRGNGYPLFPVQADRTGYINGTYLTKPINLSESDEYKKYIKDFISDLDYYVRLINELKDTYNLDIDNYSYTNIEEVLREAMENTDSKRESLNLESGLNNLNEAYNRAYDSCRKLENVESFWGSYITGWAEKLIDLGEKGLAKYISNRADNSRENEYYLESQRRPLIKSDKGVNIRSDSKVGPLTPEAEAYIRRILKNTSTEEIDAKKKARGNEHYSNNYDFIPTHIEKYADEIRNLKYALSDLKREVGKEKKLGIGIIPKKEGYYKYTGNGPYDYKGNWVGERRGGYEYTRETRPASVKFNIEGLDNLEYILSKVLNSNSIEEMQDYLEDALDVIKTMPRSNPKVAEIRERINNILNKRRDAPKVRRPLPDAKYRDSKYRSKILDLRNKK